MNLKSNLNDPIKRQVEVSAKDRGTELSPMCPPDAYNPPCGIISEKKDNHPLLKDFIIEHDELKNELRSFEIKLNNTKRGNHLFNEHKNEFMTFYSNFLGSFTTHNKNEEKYLFPLLEMRFLEIGEHSKSLHNRITPINVLENEHIQATKLATEASYILSILPRLTDKPMTLFFQKEFIQISEKLIEIVKLHIFREDNIVFMLAQKHLSEDELDLIYRELHHHQIPIKHYGL